MFLRVPEQHTSQSGSPKSLRISADLRLDNKVDLARELGLASTTSEQAIVLAAYQRWGDLCPEYLLGDFAFAIHDPNKDRLLCARDHVGVRSFYYAYSGDNFACSDSIEQLLACSFVESSINEHAVAVFLRHGELYQSEQTFYRTIKKLPPGHRMVVADGRATLARYWTPEPLECGYKRKPEDWFAELNELLEQAVVTRLSDEKVMGAHLSGGLDSSAICALASRHLQSRDQRLHTFNWMPYPEGMEAQGLQLPELEASANVARHLGLQHKYTPATPGDIRNAITGLNITLGDTVDTWSEHATRHQARLEGVSVMLSGWGGDQMISHFGQLGWRDWLSPIGALRSSRLLYRKLRSGPGVDIVAHEFLQAAIPEFAEYARKSVPDLSYHPGSSVHEDQKLQFTNGHLLNRLESWSASGSRAGIEYRYPLLDKRIIEFALSLPSELYRYKGISRYPLRSAVSSLLPHQVCWQNIKSEPFRVRRVIDSTKAALADWKNMYLNEVRQFSPWIDERRLRELLISIEQADGDYSREAIYRIHSTVKAIQILSQAKLASAEFPSEKATAL